MTTAAIDTGVARRSLAPLGLAALILAYIPVNFTFGSVNVLADDIGSDLRAGAAGQQLVLAAYTTAFAATLVIAGRLGDRMGRRRLLAIGSAGVVVLSVATALAPNLATAVALRVLLGVAAGLLTPQVLSTIQATAHGALRTWGLMLFTAMSGVATILGQLAAGALGSLLSAHDGWRAVQIATAAIAALGLAGLVAVPESRSDAALALDGSGAATLGASLLLVVVPLTLGPTLGWPVWAVVVLVAGAALLVAFGAQQARSERRGRLPIVPPSVLRITVVRRGLLMTLLFFTTYGAMLYELSALAKARFGMGALGAALLVLGFGLAFVAVSISMPRLLPVLGAHTMTVAAVAQAVVLAALGALAIAGADGFWAYEIVLVPLGVTQAMMFGPVLQTVVTRAPEWAGGVASGLFTTMQQLGLTLGVAVLGGVFWATERSAGLDPALGLVFGIHALCALVFAALARSIARR
ncbi:MFS transporter [Microbacterium indicum]|uniref:MFS transporter n=1 Tax=Microbacterium indicum TaxID=358100 RepID=UPI0004011846|nr:MFS transporter [Microbacterium indicum]